MAYDLNKIARLYDVDEVRKKLDARTKILTYNNMGTHNAFYRGKNLGTSITAEHIAAIRNTTFADIYPGDMWDLPIDGTTVARVAGCYMSFSGVTATVALLLFNNNWKFTMNDTATAEGHIMGSKMYTEHLPYILGKVKEVIPEEYIKTFIDHICDSVDSEGNPNHYQNEVRIQIALPSSTNINGIPSDHYRYLFSGKNGQWPIFRHSRIDRDRMVGRWLSENANATQWRMFKGYPAITLGPIDATATTLPQVAIAVVPYILIG